MVNDIAYLSSPRLLYFKLKLYNSCDQTKYEKEVKMKHVSPIFHRLRVSFEPRCQKTNRSSGFPTRSDTNRVVQPQEMATEA